MAKTEIIGKWMPYEITAMREECIGRPLEFKAMYINILEEMWRNNGQLDDNEDYLMAVSGATRAQWNKHKLALSGLFYVTKGNWNHNRLRDAINKAYKIADTRRASGAKANDVRWAKERKAKAAAKALIDKIALDGGTL